MAKKSKSDDFYCLLNPVPHTYGSDDEDHLTSAKLADKGENDDTEEFAVLGNIKQDVDQFEDDRYLGAKVTRKSLGIEQESDSEVASENDYDEIGVHSSESDSESQEDDYETDAVHIGADKDISETHFQHVTNSDVNVDVEKGRAVQCQLNIWDSLLECRIQMQKNLMIANRLPQFDTFKEFLKNNQLSRACKQSQKNLSVLLSSFLDLQQMLLKQFPETSDLFKSNSNEAMTHSNEEITSSSEEDDDNFHLEQNSSFPKIKKVRLNEYSEILDSQHERYAAYRNNTIQKWNDKTRIATGKISSRNFSNFEQTTLKQIEQIMSNKPRLIKRTQLKRADYQILGKRLHNKVEEETEILGVEGKTLKEYDPEIFDDSDFYHQLLRELIERKASDVKDPVQLGKKWVELQKLRSKMKRKIDTKATKGRRIKYVVHQKLVNFMAPIPDNNWSDQAKNELCASLFGKQMVS